MQMGVFSEKAFPIFLHVASLLQAVRESEVDKPK